MTEFVSAHDYAMAILQRPLEHIAATIIQKTWRSVKIEQLAEIERARSKMHKIENSIGPSWGINESDKIEDLLEGMDVIKEGNVLTFSPKCQARMKNGSTYCEPMNEEDGKEKGTTKFTLLVYSWISYTGEKKDFFNGYAKVWADDPSSKDWMDYFERVILLLEKKVSVKLWGQGGGYKNLSPGDKKLINDLKDYWRLHQIKKEIMELQSEAKKTAKKRKRKINNISKDLDPLVNEFIPEVVYAYHV